MSAIRRHNAKRDFAEPDIVDALERAGCTVIRIDQPCDLIVHHPSLKGLVALVEVKTGKAKLNDNQKALNVPFVVIRDAEQAIKAVNSWRGAVLVEAI